MHVFSSSTKKLIVVSLVSGLLVFWLGSRYWSDARNHFSGAKQLQLSAAPETTLFEIARSLDRERSAVQYVMINEKRFEGDLQQLQRLTRNTKTLFKRLANEIESVRQEESSNRQQRYSDETIDSLFKTIDDNFKRSSIARSVITGQLYLPIDRRDDQVRMRLFDMYGNFIISANNLRQRVNSYPINTNYEVLAAHEAKNSIWVLTEAINQITTIIGSLRFKNNNSTNDTINVDNLTLRLLQNHELANKAISDLSVMAQAGEIAGINNNTVTELSSRYSRVYHSTIKRITLSAPDFSDIEDSLNGWKERSQEIQQIVSDLEQIALTNTLSIASAVKRDATMALFINTCLVLLCMAMAFATFKISRSIQYQSDHDELTGIPNRRYFNNRLKALLQKTAPEKGEKLVLITLDLNGFKSINDTMGHMAGDKLLRQVSHRIKSAIPDQTFLARMGGDEFSVVFTAKTPAESFQVACGIRDTFKQPFNIDGGSVRIGTSIGYSIYPDDANTLEELQITSDFAMFNAKQSVDRVIQPFDRDIAEQYKNRITIENELVEAIRSDQLELHYQPQVDLALGCVPSMEALIRWNHPTRGTIPPIEFIGIAEEAGLMPLLGSWVLEEACRQVSSWHKTTHAPIRVAVNVSAHQITQQEFVQEVRYLIDKYQFPTECLELEITESAVMEDVNRTASCLGELKAMGVKIALDDFGTGHSSLSQLQNLPLDTLKIDKSFIGSLDSSSGNLKPVTATIASIADIYGLQTVAEGIETAEQLDEVKRLGIHMAQGYLFSKPLPLPQIPTAIRKIDGKITETRKSA